MNGEPVKITISCIVKDEIDAKNLEEILNTFRFVEFSMTKKTGKIKRDSGSFMTESFHFSHQFYESAFRIRPDLTEQEINSNMASFQKYWLSRAANKDKSAKKANWLLTWENYLPRIIKSNPRPRRQSLAEELANKSWATAGTFASNIIKSLD